MINKIIFKGLKSSLFKFTRYNISFFSNNKRIFNNLTFSSNFIFKNFSTNNQISEKESLELIEAGVFEVLKSAAKCRHEKLNRASSLEELGFDSLDQVELVVAMEEKFGINISDDDSLKIQTVLDAIQIMHSYYVKEKVNVGTIVEKEAEGVKPIDK